MAEKVNFSYFTISYSFPSTISSIRIFHELNHFADPVVLYTEALPDIAPMLQPSRLGDIASYTFFSLGGIFLGGECGLLSGAGAARRTITQDPVTKHRIEQAYLNYKEDVLKKQLKDLQSRRVGLDGEDAIAW